MQFEVSERVPTSSTKAEILSALEAQFRKVSKSVQRKGNTIIANSIEASSIDSFLSINSDTTTVEVRDKHDGYLLVANVNHRPSIAFWVIVVILLLTTWILWLIPVFLYFLHKETVRTGVQNVFTRIMHEFAIPSGTRLKKQGGMGGNGLEQIEKLAELRDKGVITEEEFQSKKKEILSI